MSRLFFGRLVWQGRVGEQEEERLKLWGDISYLSERYVAEKTQERQKCKRCVGTGEGRASIWVRGTKAIRCPNAWGSETMELFGMGV